MDAPNCFNAPRIVYLGGETYWARAITVGGLAILSGWLDDVLPERQDRVVAPDLTSPEANEAINSPMGRSLLTWLALRPVGVSYAQAEALSVKASDVEWSRLLTVLFERRRTRPKSDRESSDEPAWWGPAAVALAERFHLTFDQIADLTLDQIEALSSDGCPTEAPGYITVGDVQKMWEAAWAAKPDAPQQDQPESAEDPSACP